MTQPSGKGGATRSEGGRTSQIDDPVGGHATGPIGTSGVVVVVVVVDDVEVVVLVVVAGDVVLLVDGTTDDGGTAVDVVLDDAPPTTGTVESIVPVTQPTSTCDEQAPANNATARTTLNRIDARRMGMSLAVDRPAASSPMPYSGAWQTASTLLPSGSRTNAP